MKAENISRRNKLSEFKSEIDKQAVKERTIALKIFGLLGLQAETPLKVVMIFSEKYREFLQGRERPVIVKLKNAEQRDRFLKQPK